MLSDDASRWFDDEIWRFAEGDAGNRFALAIPPEELLVDAPSAIWPALMPCDFLPILSNSMGDWLCIKVAADNSAAQVVHWYHGGGDWIPWGGSLAEAIYFDHVRHRLPGSGRDHAIAASSETDLQDQSCRPLNQWAMGQLKDRFASELEQLHGKELAEEMVRRGLSRPAVLCQLVIDALDNSLLRSLLSGDGIRRLADGDADAAQRVLFDNQLFDDERILTSADPDLSPETVLSQQDWDAARVHVLHVTQIAPELAWGWDLLGYIHERSGQRSEAVNCYRNGLNCSIFTDQTVRVRTHGFSSEGQKFSASRLMELGYKPSEASELEYFECLRSESPSRRRDRVREHFSGLASQADAPRAHELWIRAGWDLGAEPMLAFAELLEQVASTAQIAGRVAQSELARTHRACFRDRYGI